MPKTRTEAAMRIMVTFYQAFKAKKGRGIYPTPLLLTNSSYEFAPPVMEVTPRRFCAQQASSDWVQIGRSLP
jgi:hypothetical protein